MSSDPAAVIEARGLCKTYHVYARPEDRLKQMLWRGRRRFYREFFAVRDVDLRVGHGETVGLVGRNGSGKSTLLRMICGILEPSGGTLEVRGHLAPLLTLGAGFNPDFTGRDNVVLNAAVLGLSDAQVSERMDSILAFADIGDFVDQPVRAYSSGMYARLAFAVAIHADPEILVIDEILSVGDEAFTRKCFSRIEHLKANGSTILFVSHATTSIVELCDRAVLMEAGERLLTGEPKLVVSQYRRLVHAPPEATERVRAEIREIDHDPAAAERLRAAAASTSRPTARPPEPSAAENAARASFDPRMEPKSTVAYEPRGARIENVRICDASGLPANLLHPGARYEYAFDVRFEKAATGVRFGMMLKLVSGFEFSGQVSHTAASGIDYVEAGTLVRVRFPFRARLAPGPYFANAGVVAFEDGEERYLHRILDAAMFRVEARPESTVTGRIDLAEGPAQIQIVPPGRARAEGDAGA